MSNALPFKKLISNHKLTTKGVLDALAKLPYLIYLNNNKKPIIGILPEKFCLFQNYNFLQFKQFSLEDYRIIDDDFSIDQFFKFNKTINADTFSGGLMGFVSYDYASNAQIKITPKDQPSLFLGVYHHYLSLEDGRWYFNSQNENALEVFEHINQLLINHKNSDNFVLTAPCEARWTKQQYEHAFEKIQNYIKAGDCYQINLTQEFTGKAEGSLLATTEKFWELTNAPYSGYLKVDEFELLSCSPELFIDFKANRKIVTKPIKGTMPRYSDPIKDEQSKKTLQQSEKDQAENVMIVDLLRNDLSVYAEIGSVKTPKLFNIESFNQVHHMVSEVEATLKEDINPLHVLMSALPGGSITGAPKIRAMQIIDEIEGAPRGAYCGSLGYFNYDGTGSWNILIRSIQKYQEDISLWAGGGITIASNCDAEYQECFDKVSAMLNLLNTWHKPE